MRRLLLPLLLVISATWLPAQSTYALGPDSQPQPGVPKGTVTKYILKPGKFYPGTPHHFAVYVPAQYDASKPTPFMIFLDGSGALGNGVRVPVVFDNLIAKHEIPPMIGIFIDPGILPAVSDKDQNRYERIFEYDSLSGRFAQFLLEELIPEVAKKYNLSKNPDDRGLSGVSTGAVGAFMTAWNRPDQFHRVLSFIGTYVAMKGADSLPALVRKTEPKPIRVFMQDGTNDHIVPAEPYGISYAGSWPINNQVMYQALEYSGYDVKLVMGTEGHNMKQGGAIMPDALRWLWRGYPAPIVVHENPAMHEPGWDPRGKVFETLFVDKPWEKVEGSYGEAVSPAADKDGNVFFADPGTKRIDKAAPDGTVTVFKSGVDGVSALRVGADGRLYASEPALRRIVSFGPGGDEKMVARNVEARDIAITEKGAIYFTDQAHKTVGLIDAAGHARVVVDGGGMAVPAGVTLSPDQAFVIVSDAQSRFSWSFQIAPDGSLENGEPFYRLEMPEQGWMSHAVGVREDSEGQIYFATPLGIQVCMPNGRVEEILNAPEPEALGTISGLAFAVGNPAWLYVVEGGKLYRRPVKVMPAVVWAPNKPPKPTL
ncbi:MAG: SMP-30/gluconolactonase/LRE family protein [Acidobacteriota bacterium]|nr:SMP-30/gluconolactonase/LRE family protein [Acidobacteriota bacterium]